MNFVLDIHATLKQINKYKLKFKTKPRITRALQKAIFIKNSLLQKFLTLKDSQAKEIFHKKHADYRNILNTICDKSKTNYYKNYFESNWNNMKKIWTGTKSFLTIKNISVDIPKSISVDGTNISNPIAISNVFNSCFSSVAKKTK